MRDYLVRSTDEKFPGAETLPLSHIRFDPSSTHGRDNGTIVIGHDANAEDAHHSQRIDEKAQVRSNVCMSTDMVLT